MHTEVSEKKMTKIQVEEICKTFGPTKALNKMSLQVESGQIVGLVGANGAGKTTLMKVLTGVHAPDSGTAIICGEALDKGYSPNAAAQRGVHCAYQEMTLCTNLRVYENFLLNRMSHAIRPKKAGWRRAGKKDAKAILDQVFPDNSIDVNASMSALSLMERQMVEICKAILHDNLSVLILDEPTAYLSMERIEQLQAYLRQLKTRGVGIIYISHKLNEILEICDKVCVMKNGCLEREYTTETLTREMLIEALGGVVLPREPQSSESGCARETLLEIRELNTPKLRHINMEIRRGEILGLTGLDGGGQSDLLRTLFERVERSKLPGSRGLKAAYISGNRAAEGVFSDWSIEQNIGISVLDKSTSGPLISSGKLKKNVDFWFQKLKIKAPSLKTSIMELSGGNQQKVLIARGLASDADIILMNDPTCGVDIETKQEIYRIMQEARSNGKAIVLFSTEDAEMGQCDRAYIMHEGTIVEELEGEDLTEDNIIRIAFQHKMKKKDAAQDDQAARTGKIGKALHHLLQERFMIALIAALVVFGISAYTKPAVATYRGFNMIYTSAIPWIFAALSQMFVAIGGGMDMGSGMAIGMVNVIAATYLTEQPAVAAVMLIAVCLLYALMGLFIYRTRIPGIVVTLGMSFVWQGVSTIIAPIPGGSCPAWLKVFTSFDLPVIPRPLVVGLIAALVAYWIVHRSSYGIVMNATGNRPMVAERAGWSTQMATMMLYLLAGVFVVLSGLALTALTGSGDYSGAATFPMTTIAIFILGGCEFNGAVTSPVGVVIATFAMGGISSLLTFLNINSNFQTMVYGLVLVMAMVARMIIHKARGRSAR